MIPAANGSVRVMESGTCEGANVHDRRRAWRLLWTNPDYVEDWQAHGGPVLQEPPPLPLRRQTEADLEAARWNLLAWEPPWLKRLGAPFWADVPMLEGRPMDFGEATEKTLRGVVGKSEATFMGLRLRDGALILRVERDRKAPEHRFGLTVSFAGTARRGSPRSDS